MTDAEFDLLREELIWNGSKVAVLSKDELTFLQASRAFSKVHTSQNPGADAHAMHTACWMHVC